ncbi:MAG: molybdopterin-binding protein [Candidatus Anammoxibacter sp.]
MIKAGILTISDKGSRGEREDKSREVIKLKLKEIGANVTSYEIIPDEKDLIAEKLLLLTKSTVGL